MINIKNLLNKKTTKVFLTICTGIVVSSTAMPTQASGTRGKIENIKKTKYAIECRNLKYKHARLEEIYRYGGEVALREAIQSVDYWVSSEELNYWKECQTNWWYEYL